MRSIVSKSILNKSKKRDPWFLDDYTLNPYSGCSFNCTYCYIRGSKYGEHMEEKLAFKENAVSLLDKQLALKARKGQYGIIVLSSATDPYLQWESELKLTRHLLEVIAHHRFPVHVITKSDLVKRDFDLLLRIDQNAILPTALQPLLQRGTIITFSFSTLHDPIGKLFEPGAPSPTQRLEVLRHTSASGFLTGASLMPIIPLITDSQDDLDATFAKVREAGASYLFAAGLTLFGHGPSDSAPLTRRVLAHHFPNLLASFDLLYETHEPDRYRYQQILQGRLAASRKKFPIRASII